MKKTIIGLTGPSGAGKSVVASVAEGLGFFVVDCDTVARRAVEDENLLFALCEAFGRDIIRDGRLDRRELALRAFSSADNTALLNRLTLPVIAEYIEKMIEGKSAVVLDAPTLYESGLDKRCDLVVGVLADKDTRRERIVARDSLTERDADARMKAAKTDEFFRFRCDLLLINDGSLEELKTKAAEMLSEYITEE